MADLKSRQRDKLPDASFAFPKERKLPLSDAAHVRNAAARFNQVRGVTTAEKKAAKGRIQRAARKTGVELSKEPD